MTEYIMGKGEALPKLCVLHSALTTQNADPHYELQNQKAYKYIMSTAIEKVNNFFRFSQLFT